MSALKIKTFFGETNRKFIIRHTIRTTKYFFDKVAGRNNLHARI
jgi:hypothetical protein